MNSGKHVMDNLEYLKNNDLMPGTVNTPNSVETPGPPQNHGDVSAESAENDAAAEEREEQIERWMNDIKSFIRKIDVSRL